MKGNVHKPSCCSVSFVLHGKKKMIRLMPPIDLVINFILLS